MGRCPDEIRQCEAGGSGLQRKGVWEGAVVNGSLLLRRGCLGAAWNVSGLKICDRESRRAGSPLLFAAATSYSTRITESRTVQAGQRSGGEGGVGGQWRGSESWRRSAQRARRDREIESEWNCAQLHFWRREGEAEVQARPAQAHVHPTTAQWAQTTVHKAQAAQQQQHHGRPRDGRQLSIHAMQTMCLCYHRPTNHVVRFRSSGCGGTGVSNSAIASNFSETLRHCTALHCCWLLLCCPSFGHAVGCIQDDRRQRQVHVGLLLFFATLCHHSPPSFTFLYSHPHSTPAHASAKAVSATVPLVRQEAHAAAAAVARLVLDHVAPGSQPTTD